MASETYADIVQAYTGHVNDVPAHAINVHTVRTHAMKVHVRARPLHASPHHAPHTMRDLAVHTGTMHTKQCMPIHSRLIPCTPTLCAPMKCMLMPTLWTLMICMTNRA
jgi:hypothetical protein